MWMYNSVNQLDLYLSVVGGGDRSDFIYLFSGLSHFDYSRLLKQLNQSICVHPSVSQLINQDRQKEKRKDNSWDEECKTTVPSHFHLLMRKLDFLPLCHWLRKSSTHLYFRYFSTGAPLQLVQRAVCSTLKVWSASLHGLKCVGIPTSI